MADRLPPQPGEWIDRSHQVEFQFEGRMQHGYRGDVIASALWAQGVRVTGRSFKYHRPRGPYSMAGLDVNAMFTDGVRTNIRGDVTPINEHSEYRAVNTFGSLAHDRMNVTEYFSRFMPVGFYYKAFYSPAWLFPFHENQMRKVAGLGEINPDFPATNSPKDYAFCDVLVIGGGPSGLAAARAAADSGARVMLVDEHVKLGGSLAYQHGSDPRKLENLNELISAVEKHERIEVRTNTCAAGYYADHWVALVNDEKLTKLRAKAVVAATGVMEQPAVFNNNDLPGVMLASAAQRLMRLYAVKPFERAVVLAANEAGYRAALDLHEVGVEVAAVVDLRPSGETTAIREQVQAAGITIYAGHTIYEAIVGRGKRRVRAAEICPIDETNQPQADKIKRIKCDGIAVSVGYMPAAGMIYQGGGRFTYDDAVHQLIPGSLPEGLFVAGRVRGVYDLDAKQIDGRCAGLAAAKYLGFEVDAMPSVPELASPSPSHPYPIYAHAKKKNFVEFDEDLNLKDFVNAHQEGYDNIELQKRYTTVGMGPSQGKLANMNSVRILAKLNGDAINQTGTTTSRPFTHPVAIGHLAGRRFHPMRRTPMHQYHADAGAVFFHAGTWYRPEYYAVEGKTRAQCILDEAVNVRQRVGMIDVSTLGKLYINGPDAAVFLECIYTGNFQKLAVGRYRYGVALDESAVVIEDGVIARLADDRFYVTATSSGADAFYREMQRWIMIWGLDVTVSNATAHVAAMNIAGPLSRELLAPLTDIDLDAGAFPYLGVRMGNVLGRPATLMRVGFVGELGYEIHTPAEHAAPIWEALMAEGIRPFGVEAQRLLRLEKGHLIGSHDTDALTNPDEADVTWAIGKQKDFYIGQRSLQAMRRRPLERKLVGIRFDKEHTGPLPEECHLIIDQGRIAGRVTSIAHRSTQGYPLGMAFVEPQLATPGTPITIRVDRGEMVTAKVAVLPFYDPKNQRQRM